MGRKHNNTQFIFNHFCDSNSKGNGNTVGQGGIPKGRAAFSLYKCAICLPSSPGVGVHSRSQSGEVLTRGSPGVLAIWNGEGGECWVVLVFMIRTGNVGLLFGRQPGVIEGFCLATRTVTLIKESYKRNICYLYKI